MGPNGLRDKVKLLIDGRMGAEHYQQYTLRKPTIREYKGTWYSDEKGSTEPCNAKATSYCSNMAGSFITNAIWTDIGKLLTLLWVFVLLVIIFAANLLLGHILIPSLVATKHVTKSALRLRPALYGASVLAFMGVIVVIALIANLALTLENLFPKWFL